MNIFVSKTDTMLRGTVRLPGSKSESNRALIMQALCRDPLEILNLSEAADTVTLRNILENREREPVMDVGPAGTAMRFLTAFCAVTAGEWTLTGSKRMKERPIGLLVDALRQLGADIEYLEKEGFPPMKIRGKQLGKASRISIPGNISSQYISALLMIAPTLPGGLEIGLTGEIASRPYIEMTLSMMRELGIAHRWEGNRIRIAAQEYRARPLTIEPDWSGASYWYSMAALCTDVDLELPYLKENSLQGDQAIAGIMAAFGVKTTFSAGGIRLSRENGGSAGSRQPDGSNCEAAPAELDLVHCPDLAQTVISCCTALRRDLTFRGLESLKIKETDRIAALQAELGKFGGQLLENEAGNSWRIVTSGIGQPASPPFIHTYHDHRMAMALAPLAIRLGPMEIEDRDVVAKSYPSFWDDLLKVGFTLTETPKETQDAWK